MRTLFSLLLLLALPCSTDAQTFDTTPDPLASKPVGPFVVDARAAFPKLPQDGTIAAGIGVTVPNLPTRALGLVFGAHVYPLHGRSVALGLGGEVLMSRRGRTLEPATEGGPPGPAVTARFSAISPQLSVNFGGRDGWSYLSGGIGWGRYSAERDDRLLTGSAPRVRTINYGGGARWFVKKRLGLSLDLRFYRLNGSNPTGGQPVVSPVRSMTVSAGVALR